MAAIVALALPTLLALESPRAARADDKQVCLSTYVRAQELRKDERLRAAREAMLACAQTACPPAIAQDCGRWLTEVEGSIPTVVLSLVDRAGQDRSDVRVRLDGAPLVERLDGKALEVDPGEHVFRFETSGEAPIEQRVVVRQGERDRPIRVELPRASAAPALAPSSAAARPIPLATWVVGGVGVAALGVSAAFGASALWGSPGWTGLRSCKPTCNPADVDAVDRKLRIADVALGVGVVALGAAAVFYVTRPSEGPPQTVALAPLPGGALAAWTVVF